MTLTSYVELDIVWSSDRLKIWRPKRQLMNYAPQVYHISKITPSSARRLIRLFESVAWDYDEDEDWFESGYGYDYITHHGFAHDPEHPQSDDKQILATWFRSVIEEAAQ